MEGIYDVWMPDKIAGQVMVSREGLYYRFLCTVKIPKESHYHVMAQADSGIIDLGLCVPQGDLFVLSTKMPVKRFDKREYRYVLSEKTVKQVIPVFVDKPFVCLNKLTEGYFAKENHIPVIVIRQKESNRA